MPQDEVHDIEVAAATGRIIPILQSEVRHGRGEVYALPPVRPVKALGDKCVVLLACLEDSGLCGADPRPGGKQVTQVLPQPRIIVISPRGELSDTERAVCIYDAGLRPSSSQRRPWLYELVDPAFFGEFIS